MSNLLKEKCWKKIFLTTDPTPASPHNLASTNLASTTYGASSKAKFL
jgi:hypothetical protein